ncbi:hypothetical protein TURU_091634 [Turdus rufiventris]|nr:hypothetical protein TURU_091634 [Turdus rufiventris]
MATREQGQASKPCDPAILLLIGNFVKVACGSSLRTKERLIIRGTTSITDGFSFGQQWGLAGTDFVQHGDSPYLFSEATPA